jgi:hypothetical protein
MSVLQMPNFYDFSGSRAPSFGYSWAPVAAARGLDYATYAEAEMPAAYTSDSGWWDGMSGPAVDAASAELQAAKINLANAQVQMAATTDPRTGAPTGAALANINAAGQRLGAAQQGLNLAQQSEAGPSWLQRAGEAAVENFPGFAQAGVKVAEALGRKPRPQQPAYVAPLSMSPLAMVGIGLVAVVGGIAIYRSFKK